MTLQELFAVDDVTGDVIVVGDIDYERSTGYHLQVRAVDGGSLATPEVVMAALTADVAVHVRVDDVNDNRPEMVINTLATSGAHVAEVYSSYLLDDELYLSNNLTKLQI